MVDPATISTLRSGRRDVCAPKMPMPVCGRVQRGGRIAQPRVVTPHLNGLQEVQMWHLRCRQRQLVGSRHHRRRRRDLH